MEINEGNVSFSSHHATSPSKKEYFIHCLKKKTRLENNYVFHKNSLKFASVGNGDVPLPGLDWAGLSCAQALERASIKDRASWLMLTLSLSMGPKRTF